MRFRWATESNEPRPIAWVVINTNPRSTWVQPRAVGRREVQMKARPPREPGFHSGVLVRPVVVADQVHVQMPRDVRRDAPQERQERLMTVLGLARVSTVPLATSSAANNVVVPWRR